ncbi:hypothetical protein H5410_003040 [Solanum commersonii]|uniref:DUF4283 domain-containing protein n=1 Tax=Solanum commersonii TaxID=4109 RepID=A0A9J6B3X0_SOLCO|nr:hypothetical protein H5410_003040 [Solanum commersonii]
MEEEVHLTNISINIAQEHLQEAIQEVDELNDRTEADQQGTFSHDHVGPNGQQQDLQSREKQKLAMNLKQGDTRLSQDENDQPGNAKSTTLEVIEVESSSHFSFGIKPTSTLPSNGGEKRTCKTNNYNNEFDHGHRTVVILSSSDDQMNVSAKGQKNGMLNDPEQGWGNFQSQQQVERNHSSEKKKGQFPLSDQGGNSEPNNYHKEFPKISSNFDRHTIPNQKGQQNNPPNQSKGPSNTNENQKTKKDQSAEPTPYTVVQTLAARLRQIHATHSTSIELVPPRHNTKQGQPAMIYDMDGFMNKLVVDCKHTLIGKFSNTMPKIELIRERFILQTQLNGGGACTPNFRPEVETPIVPIWVLLSGLPWHCFKKEFITPLLESVGKVLYLDTTSIKRTRASMAKVKVQVDLTKTRPRHVWIGLDDEDLIIGRW